MAKKKTTPPEWSHFIDIEDVGLEPQSFFLSASEEDRQNVARRLNLENIDELSATLNLSQDSGGRIYADGHLKAKVTQRCVITLDPLEAWIEEDFNAWFADTEQRLSFEKARKERETRKKHAEIEISHEQDDPEPIIDGKIDAGELVVQYLSLAINPYPHTEGVHYELGDDTLKTQDPSPLRKNPFEALKNWKENR